MTKMLHMLKTNQIIQLCTAHEWPRINRVFKFLIVVIKSDY